MTDTAQTEFDAVLIPPGVALPHWIRLRTTPIGDTGRRDADFGQVEQLIDAHRTPGFPPDTLPGSARLEITMLTHNLQEGPSGAITGFGMQGTALFDPLHTQPTNLFVLDLIRRLNPGHEPPTVRGPVVIFGVRYPESTLCDLHLTPWAELLPPPG